MPRTLNKNRRDLVETDRLIKAFRNLVQQFPACKPYQKDLADLEQRRANIADRIGREKR